MRDRDQRQLWRNEVDFMTWPYRDTGMLWPSGSGDYRMADSADLAERKIPATLYG